MGAVWTNLDTMMTGRWTVRPVGAYPQIASPLKL